MRGQYWQSVINRVINEANDRLREAKESGQEVQGWRLIADAIRKEGVTHRSTIIWLTEEVNKEWDRRKNACGVGKNWNRRRRRGFGG